ncbi:MAG: UPF0280 family protein [Bacillota bacterium]
MMNSNRIYRRSPKGKRLRSFPVVVKESDLWIAVSSSSFYDQLPEETEQLVWQKRLILEKYLGRNSDFASALEPFLLEEEAPDIICRLVRAGNLAGVGPMAAVAGLIAEETGRFLLNKSQEVVVENGGDIFLKVVQPVNIGIYAGSSPLSGKLALQVNPAHTPQGICTSSGTVGPSYSMGKADAAVAVSKSCALADAAATAIGNMIRGEDDLQAALEFAQSVEGVSGALVIYCDKIAAWGDVELSRVSDQ